MRRVSVILSTGSGRPSTLENTLKSWGRITHPDFDFTVILNDLDDTETEKVVKNFPFAVYKSTNAEAVPPNILWTREGKQSRGDYVVFAMADILLGSYDLLEQMESSDPSQRASAMTYYMDETGVTLLPTIDWLDNPKLIEDLPSFWTHVAVKGDPVPNQDGHDASLTTYLTGATREYWDWIGWFREDELGYLNMDTDLVLRERFLGKKPVTVSHAYHQWHPAGVMQSKHKLGAYIYKTEQQARLLEPAQLGD